jgi:hypothetical protein
MLGLWETGGPFLRPLLRQARDEVLRLEEEGFRLVVSGGKALALLRRADALRRQYLLDDEESDPV